MTGQKTMGSTQPAVCTCLPEQLTAIGVIFVVDSFLQNTAEMKGQPAQSKNQHQAEHRLRYFPPLQHPHTKTNTDASEFLSHIVQSRGHRSQVTYDYPLLTFALVPVSCGRWGRCACLSCDWAFHRTWACRRFPCRPEGGRNRSRRATILSCPGRTGKGNPLSLKSPTSIHMVD